MLSCTGKGVLSDHHVRILIYGMGSFGDVIWPNMGGFVTYKYTPLRIVILCKRARTIKVKKKEEERRRRDMPVCGPGNYLTFKANPQPVLKSRFPQISRGKIFP